MSGREEAQGPERVRKSIPENYPDYGMEVRNIADKIAQLDDNYFKKKVIERSNSEEAELAGLIAELRVKLVREKQAALEQFEKEN